MLRRELLTGARRACLKEQRSTLWAGLADVRSGYRKKLALVVDGPHEVRLRVDAGRAVQLHGVVAPGRLEELVDDLDVLLGLRVAVVVLFVFVKLVIF